MKASRSFHAVPPSPEVMALLHAEYLRYRGKKKLSFHDYLLKIGFTDPAANLKGADRGTRPVGMRHGELVDVPSRKVSGPLRILVLLADFADNQAMRAPSEYEDMLFSKRKFQTGSMRDFYAEVSCGKVDVTGTVAGWFRMPQPYAYYVGKSSGMGRYPHNAQRLAEDVLAAARKKGVKFDPSLDKFGDGAITGLFVVHAGQGAETLSTVARQNRAIWSHKADMKDPVKVSGTLTATNYLTVPEDCRMGVCAHELGHLAFGWDDFYDPNYDEDGSEWDGAGVWDLMAGGSWNNGGLTPAHPAGLHLSQHGWPSVTELTKSKTGLTIPPYKKGKATIVRIQPKTWSATQCLILENRRRIGFDKALPGEGLLVWRVDTARQQTSASRPAMLLIQADGRHDLEDPADSDDGDPGDPFPGAAHVVSVGDTGSVSTSFPKKRSGVSLENIRVAADGSVKLDVIMK